MFAINTPRGGRAILALVVAFLLVWGYWRLIVSSLELLETYERPDHRYAVQLLRVRTHGRVVRPVVPGDSDGVLRLVDAQGHIFKESSIDLLRCSCRVAWRDRRVAVDDLVDWRLPD